MGSKVTVVLATYNGGKYIRRQLESIASQTVLPEEILISDDGSTDDTLSVVSEFAAQTNIPTRVIRGPGTGFSENFLTATDHVRTTYAAFCDQDDVWRPTKLEKCLNNLREDRSVLAVHAVSVIDVYERATGRDPQGITEDGIAARFSLGPWVKFLGFTMVFEVELLKCVSYGSRGHDVIVKSDPLSHDRWVCFLAGSLGRISLIADELACYRRHDRQLFGPERQEGRSRGPRWGVRPKLSRYSRSIRELPSEVDDRHQTARTRTALLMQAELTERYDLAEAAAHWSAWATCLGERKRLYSAVGFRSSLGVMVHLALSGTYKSFEAGGLGPRAAVQDLLWTSFYATKIMSRFRALQSVCRQTESRRR